MANKKILTIVNGERVAIDSIATDLSLKSVLIGGAQIKKAELSDELDIGNTKLHGVAEGTESGHAINYAQLQEEIVNRDLAIEAARGYNVEYVKISPEQAESKTIELAGTPTKPNRTLLDVIGGSAQRYAEDFSVTENILSWEGTTLESLLQENDELRIVWF